LSRFCRYDRDSGLRPHSPNIHKRYVCRQVYERVRIVQHVRQGITVWVHGWWWNPDKKKSIAEEHMRRWCRSMVHRLGAYNVIWVLAGEYNMQNYGGGDVWRAHVPQATASRGAWPWELEFDRDTLDYPGARSSSFMATFLRRIDGCTLEPHPQLVHENRSRFCGAVPGRQYLVFLRRGGALRLDLRLSSTEQQFEFRWIDLVEEKSSHSAANPIRRGCIIRPQLRIAVRRSGGIHRPQFGPLNSVVQMMTLCRSWRST
jgi:hypothetical protein